MAKKDIKFVTIDASVLGIKKGIAVAETIRNQRKAMKMQLAMSQLGDVTEDDSPSLQIERFANIIDTEVEFIVAILELTEAQADTVWDLDQEEIGAIIMDIISKLMHLEVEEQEETKIEE